MKISFVILLVVAHCAFLKTTTTDGCVEDLVAAYENLLTQTKELNSIENDISQTQANIDHLDEDLTETNEALHALTVEKQTLTLVLHSSEAEQVAITDEYETNQGLFLQIMDMIGEKPQGWQDSNETGITALAQVKTLLTTMHDTNMDNMDDN